MYLWEHDLPRPCLVDTNQSYDNVPRDGKSPPRDMAHTDAHVDSKHPKWYVFIRLLLLQPLVHPSASLAEIVAISGNLRALEHDLEGLLRQLRVRHTHALFRAGLGQQQLDRMQDPLLPGDVSLSAALDFFSAAEDALKVALRLRREGGNGPLVGTLCSTLQAIRDFREKDIEL